MHALVQKFASRYLGKITQGALHVRYKDGTSQHYGDPEAQPIDLRIHHNRFFTRIMLYGDIGFAESYMDGDFDADDLEGLIRLAIENSKVLGALSGDEKRFRLSNLLPLSNRIHHLMRRNSRTRARKNIAQHYDLSNDFFALMLDHTMMYSGAVFAHAHEPLHVAQERKIRLMADRLRLRPGSRVLEIGSGWGAMALHLAKERGVEVVSLTLSKEQKALCEARFRAHDVAGAAEVLLCDYRDMQGSFDAIIAVEMFEAVGQEYFAAFFTKCEALLKPHGVMAMQVITMPDHRYERYAKGVDFIQKYIFPGGHLPSLARILHTTQRHTRLELLEMQEFTEDYALTLRLWRENFEAKIDKVKTLGFDETFIRMWRLYLCYCEAAFATRQIHLVQLAFSRDNNVSLHNKVAA
ncbi:MAG: class I SAM-dependent methyltransferase [Campylobacterales bacterium]|nr:class I SAM-dependent methyltransferase [Campylobacterales bacterium]